MLRGASKACLARSGTVTHVIDEDDEGRARRGRGLAVEVIWFDVDVVELRVSVASSEFSGSVDVYAGHGSLAEDLETLAGFPRGKGDARAILWGQFGREWAGGAAELRFACIGVTGRSIVQARLEAGEELGGVVQAAVIAFEVDAGSIDRFLGRMRQLASDREGRAFLPDAR
jgi:hypothetical protein